ncbi:hypothetical protein ACQ4WX_48660 [Streptomyces lasalocidi]
MSTFALCAGSLTYVVTLAGEEDWTSPAVLSLLALAALALVVFARVELRSPAPLLDVRLFARASFSAVMMCVVASRPPSRRSCTPRCGCSRGSAWDRYAPGSRSCPSRWPPLPPH